MPEEEGKSEDSLNGQKKVDKRNDSTEINYENKIKNLLNNSDDQENKIKNILNNSNDQEDQEAKTESKPKEEKEKNNNSNSDEKNNKTEKSNPHKKVVNFLKNTGLFIGSLILDALIVLTIVVVVRVFIVSPFQVKGHSMDSSFSDNDFILVDQLSYRFKDPQRGDIIVFRPPSNNLYEQKGILCNLNKLKAKILKQDLTKACLVPEYYVKRIIGIPGDTVEIREGKVYLTPLSKGEQIELKEPYLNETNKDKTCISGSFSCTTEGDREGKKYVVPVDSYFVLGDNRNASNDSRLWSKNPYASFENIRGKVKVILWPINDLKIVSNINPLTGE